MAERILTLIAQRCRPIVSIGEVSLTHAGGQNIFDFRKSHEVLGRDVFALASNLVNKKLVDIA